MHTARRIVLTAQVLFFAWLANPVLPVSARETQDFDADWRFSLELVAAAMVPSFDDSAWRAVTLPHDWSSEGPFRAEYGSGNGFAPGGIGWYRKHFHLPAAQTNQTVAIEFDGVYDYAEVWVNGQFVGERPFGYASFQFDLTPFVQFGTGENVVAVRVDHSRFADSRYYTGSGIYRNVRLVITDPLRIAPWGTFVSATKITSNAAVVRVETTVENAAAKRKFSLQSDLLAPDGRVVASLTTTKTAASNAVQTLVQEMKVLRPELWSPATPQLYMLRSRVLSGATLLDETATPFGLRTATFEAAKGFFLNGVATKLKGVCLHHDAGSLGAAVPDQVLERRLRQLKDIGVNAIRTSHNPPDPELLNLCDRLGFLVMDEAFDEFTPSKRKWVGGWNSGAASRFGYAELFDQWAVTDIQDMVRRDRNHTSIILWSIGNEIDYANDPFTHPVLGKEHHPENPPAEKMIACARPLIAAVKALDRTRPVTAALATVAMSDAVGLPQLLDVAGYNYQENRYAEDHQKYPQRVIYGSENGHPYEAWLAVRDHDYISGQFLWTGIDYLGEADRWPNRANGSGLFDLCGFKKPLGWFRQSLWSDQPMVYLCANNHPGPGGQSRHGGVESWNWPVDSKVTVSCYANCPQVELLLNGKRVGTKQAAEADRGVLRWEVAGEPGVLKAVGRDENWRELCHFELQTAGVPQRIELLPDTQELHADGKAVSHVEFRIVDAAGVRVPDAQPEVTFELTGPARIIGLGNGDLNNSEDPKGNTHRTFHGRGLAILQATATPGNITLKASAPGLEPASVTLPSR